MTHRCRLMVMLAALLLAVAPAMACLWDRDTLAVEASGRLDVVNAILGRFDRFPPAYYEARLARVAKELDADPTRLDLYDDAAVACDRLQRPDDAIAWMARKRAQLDALPTNASGRADHEYRYLANLGTFHAHRWVAGGASYDVKTDLRTARDLIAKAIALNPDAHFGREKYQLDAIDWLLKPPFRGSSSTLPSMLPIDDDKRPTPEELDKALKGFAGLVALGAAAESPDVMHTLAMTAGRAGHSSVSFLAFLRQVEVMRAGRRSLHPSARDDDADMAYSWGSHRYEHLEDHDEDAMRQWFAEARAATEQWREARMAYLDAMLARGEHPDTHPKVWAKAPDGPALPSMPGQLTPMRIWRDLWNSPTARHVMAVVGFSCFVAALAILLRRLVKGTATA